MIRIKRKTIVIATVLSLITIFLAGCSASGVKSGDETVSKENVEETIVAIDNIDETTPVQTDSDSDDEAIMCLGPVDAIKEIHIGDEIKVITTEKEYTIPLTPVTGDSGFGSTQVYPELLKAKSEDRIGPSLPGKIKLKFTDGLPDNITVYGNLDMDYTGKVFAYVPKHVLYSGKAIENMEIETGLQSVTLMSSWPEGGLKYCRVMKIAVEMQGEMYEGYVFGAEEFLVLNQDEAKKMMNKNEKSDQKKSKKI